MVSLVILYAPTCYAEPPYNVTDAQEFDPDDLPWTNETDIIIFPAPPLPPFFSDFDITPTEIMLGEDLIISFVIRNPNNRTFNWMSTTRIGGFFTQIIEIELEAYESKIIWYRIIPHLVQAQYDVWIDGQTGTFSVLPPDPWPVIDEVDPVIIIVDPLEELNEQIDYLNTTLQDLTTEFFLLQTDYNVDIEELNLKIDNMRADIESLEKGIKTRDETSLIALLTMAVAAAVIWWRRRPLKVVE